MKTDNILFKYINNYGLIVIITIGFLLRFIGIDHQSLWLDEIHTINEANPNYSLLEVYNSVYNTEQMPPLYFIIIHFLFKIFGYTSLVLRSFSAICGVMGIYSIYLLSKELFNKRVAIISALLVSVNYFGIYYSQDGRPYSFLFLFTTLSFFYLVRYIKTPNYKNSILYGFFTSLMLYGHFFALFTLFSQILILFFFIILINKKDKWNFIKQSFISGIIILILHIPSIKTLLNISKIQSFWVEEPSKQVYTSIYNQFFGESELLLFLTGVSFILYFLSVFKEKGNYYNYENIISNKKVFSYIIFIFWITITLIIPLIRSYLQVPMIVNRYFMVLLPAIIIITSYGFYQIKSKLILISVLTLFIVFSLTDIIIVKNYYKNHTKTQFREVSQFIIDNNSNNDVVVSPLSWYFPYFLNNDVVKTTLISKDLDLYVNEMKQDSTKYNNFWYVNAHGNKYVANEETNNYLKANFEIEDDIEYLDSWAKHYVKKTSESNKIDVSKFTPFKKINGHIIKYGIDDFSFLNRIIKIDGWACLENQDYNNSKLKILLKSQNEIVNIIYNKKTRIDVSKSFNNEFDLNNSGFSVIFNTTNLPKGKYELGIYIYDKTTLNEGLVFTEKIIEILE
jgi:uncharacterized membrane protein